MAGWSCTPSDPTNATPAKSVCTNSCGNGIIDAGEECDLGTAINEAAGTYIKGCTTSCIVEPGFYCPGGATKCDNVNGALLKLSTLCGDGITAGLEACDDKNTVSLDGCKNDCTATEASWTCSTTKGTTASCQPLCNAASPYWMVGG